MFTTVFAILYFATIFLIFLSLQEATLQKPLWIYELIPPEMLDAIISDFHAQLGQEVFFPLFSGNCTTKRMQNSLIGIHVSLSHVPDSLFPTFIRQTMSELKRFGISIKCFCLSAVFLTQAFGACSVHRHRWVFLVTTHNPTTMVDWSFSNEI